MKKKWLIGLISALMAVAMCFGFAACGGNDVDEAAAVKNLIGQVKTRYLDSATETFSDYEVIGQAPYEGTSYAITWTVSSDDADYADYVKVGAMDQTTKLVTIDITLGTKAVNYTLTATVTVGSVTDSISFNRVVPVTYTVAQAKELLSGYSNQQYYQVDGEVVAVAVQGYVVNTGNLSSYNNIQNAYIADSADETTKANQCQVYGLELDDTFIKTADDLVTGAYIVIVGALQYYNGPEITFNNNAGIKPHTVAYTLPDLSDTEKVSRAKAALDFYPTLYTTAGAEKELSTTLENASITWAVTSGNEYASVSGSTLKIASPLPTTQQAVVLTATIKSGSVTDTKEFNIKVGPLSRTTPSTKDNPLTVEEAQEILLTLDNGDYSEKVYVQGYVTDAGSWSSSNSNWTGVKIATTKGDTTAAKQLLVYRLTADGTVLAKEESALAVGDRVTVYGYLNNYNGTYELNYKSGDNVTCVETDHAGGGVAELTKVFKPIESNPQPGTYYLAMKGSDDKYHYLTGSMATGKSSHYMATVTEADDAAEVTLAGSTTDGWTITCGGKYIELIKDSDYYNAVYNDAQTAGKTWVWDTENQLFYQTIESAEYVLGTTGTFTTVGAITRTNALGSNGHYGVLGTLEEPSDDDKAQAVLDSLELTTTEFYALNTDGIALPTSDAYGANVEWTLKAGGTNEYVSTAGNKLYINKLPESGKQEIELHVVVTVGGGSAESDVTITVEKDETNYGTQNAPLSVSAALTIAQTQCTTNGNWTKQPVYMKGIAKNTPEEKSGDSGKYYQSLTLIDETETTKEILIYSISLATDVAAPAQHDVLVISGYITRFGYTTGGTDGTIEFSSKDTTYVTALSNTRGESTITLEAEGATVSGISNNEKVTNGTEKTFTVQAAAGRQLVSVTAGKETLTAQSENTYKITVLGDVTVKVTTIGEGEKVSTPVATLTFGATVGANDGKAGGYTTTWTAVRDGVTWSIANFNNNSDSIGMYKSNWTYIKAGRKYNNKDVPSVATITTTLSQIITSVEITFDSSSKLADIKKDVQAFKLQVCDDDTFAGTTLKEYSIDVSSLDLTVNSTFEIPENARGANKHYRIVFDTKGTTSSNGYIVIDSVIYNGYIAD